MLHCKIYFFSYTSQNSTGAQTFNKIIIIIGAQTYAVCTDLQQKKLGKNGENNETKMKKLKEDQGYKAYIKTQPKNDNCLNNVVHFTIYLFIY